MTDPCRYCVAPERYPGCHDHCDKLKAHRESDEYKKLCDYKEKYFSFYYNYNIAVSSFGYGYNSKCRGSYKYSGYFQCY